MLMMVIMMQYLWVNKRGHLLWENLDPLYQESTSLSQPYFKPFDIFKPL